MPHLESKTKLIMTASVNKYINPKKNMKMLKKSFFLLKRLQDSKKSCNFAD